MDDDIKKKVYSHFFFNFSSKKLIKSSSSELVDESVNLLRALWHSESEMNININISIIFSWAFLNWCIVVDDIFSE